MCVMGYTEGVCQFLAALDVDLAAVDCEHTATEPSLLGSELGVEGISCLAKKSTHEFGRDLVPCVAQRRSGYGLVTWQGQAERLRLIPERIDQMAVAATIRVGDHVEQEGNQHVRTEWARSTEVTLLAAKLFRRGGGQKGGDEVKIRRCAGMGIA